MDFFDLFKKDKKKKTSSRSIENKETDLDKQLKEVLDEKPKNKFGLLNSLNTKKNDKPTTILDTIEKIKLKKSSTRSSRSSKTDLDTQLNDILNTNNIKLEQSIIDKTINSVKFAGLALDTYKGFNNPEQAIGLFLSNTLGMIPTVNEIGFELATVMTSDVIEKQLLELELYRYKQLSIDVGMLTNFKGASISLNNDILPFSSMYEAQLGILGSVNKKNKFGFSFFIGNSKRI